MRFCYYASSDRSVFSRMKSIADEVFLNTNEHRLEGAFLITQAHPLERYFYNRAERYGYLCGYVRDYSLDRSLHLKSHNESFFDQLFAGTWPLNDNYTGTFSAIAADNDRVIIANDLIGLYPLYYYRSDRELIISSSLIAIGALVNEAFDDVGILQRITGPDFCNFGKRTTVRNVSRLLPGEYLEFSLRNFSIAQEKLDLTMFRVNRRMDLKQAAESIESTTLEEYEIALRFDREAVVTQSGGLDSRLMLASIPEDKIISCLTYGNNDHYETVLAEKCAQICKRDFTNFPIIPSLQFSNRELFSEYILRTEAASINEWFSLFENIEGDHFDVTLLLGDMCESIMGRNIKSLREMKISDFWLIMTGQPVRLECSKPGQFTKWKEECTKKYLANAAENRNRNHPGFNLDDFIEDKVFSTSREEIMEGFRMDLKELFDLIEKHELEYAASFNELFAWYTHGRISMSRQILLGNLKYHSISPSMSVKSMRLASSINPSLRAFTRLMNRVLKGSSDPTLKRLVELPTTSVPYLPYSLPLPLNYAMNLLRNKVDVYLTRRIIKRKNPRLKYRMTSSLHWPELYNTETAESGVKSWFADNFLGKLADNCLDIVRSRKNGDSWPLSTYDVVSIASVNVEMSLVTGLRTRFKN